MVTVALQFRMARGRSAKRQVFHLLEIKAQKPIELTKGKVMHMRLLSRKPLTATPSSADANVQRGPTRQVLPASSKSDGPRAVVEGVGKCSSTSVIMTTSKLSSRKPMAEVKSIS